MDAKAVGRTVRWARKRAGMTQQELAHATGVPQPSIARIERGTVIPRTATLITVLRATGYQLSLEPIDAAVDREAIRRQLAMDVPRRTQSLGRSILLQLRRFGVPFVLVGDLAEVAQGSLATVGQVIEVCVASADVARKRLKLARGNLSTSDAKHLRVLTQTAAGDDYDVIVRNAVPMHVQAGILVKVADLEDLIRDRRARGTPEDDAAAAVLRSIVDESG